MIVTNYKRTLKNGESKYGYYMDNYLVSNLIGIKDYLKKSWDVVGIVSGHGKVRIGKSRMGSQVCYLIAWLLAGGNIEIEIVDRAPKLRSMTSPNKEVRFNLKENIVFSAQDLQDTAFKLYEKYGKNQVILYDEGRQGLDSARAMENINKGMADFFQECGFMGHVIIIVLPNFFKLHEDYAVARSLFLIDVYADKHNNRGFFSFYNELRKEQLYFFGKRLIGVTARYAATYENFWGRFIDFIPFDEKEYDELKKKALQKKRLTRQQVAWKKQRDALIYILNTKGGMTRKDIANEITVISGEKITYEGIKSAIANVTHKRPDEIEDEATNKTENTP